MEQISDHFNGKTYFNPHANVRKLKEVAHWLWNRQIAPWPYTKIEPQSVQHQRVPHGELWVTFINHSTSLIQMDGWNILTDPIWSERASPFKKIGPKRVYAPGVKFEDLPSIDIVLISHNHYDHLDVKTLKMLQSIHRPHFYTSKGNYSLLKSIGLTKVKEFDWWELVGFSSEHVLFCVPAQHFSGRGLWDRDKTLWGGFVIKSLSKMVYFAGDTGYGPHFKEIRERLGEPDLSLLPIGSFKPEWFMKPIHMSPQEAIKAHLDLASKQSMGIHFDTFQLGDEQLHEAPSLIEKELNRQHLSPEQFWILKPGEGRQVVINP